MSHQFIRKYFIECKNKINYSKLALTYITTKSPIKLIYLSSSDLFLFYYPNLDDRNLLKYQSISLVNVLHSHKILYTLQCHFRPRGSIIIIIIKSRGNIQHQAAFPTRTSHAIERVSF